MVGQLPEWLDHRVARYRLENLVSLDHTKTKYYFSSLEKILLID